MRKYWIRFGISLVVTALIWLSDLVIQLPAIEFQIGMAAIIAAAVTVCFLVTAVGKQIRPQISAYKLFGWADAVIGLIVLAYSVYDLRTDTGFLAGLVGAIFILCVLPALALILLIDLILYFVAKRKAGRA